MSSETFPLPRARRHTLAQGRSAKRRRTDLIAKLGGKCALCGSTDELEFDHPYGREWRANRVNRWHRMTLYEQDFEFGNLRLLCKPCNVKHLPETDF